MGSIFSHFQTTIFQQDRSVAFYPFLFSSLVATTAIIWSFFFPNIKSLVTRLIRIHAHKKLINFKFEGSDEGTFVSYYRRYLCHLQKTNNDVLLKILQKNHSCAFFVEKSISFLSFSPSIKQDYTLIDEFREKVPLTTYDDYHDYIDRMINNGEKNLLSFDQPIYFAVTSGTTGKNKHIPITPTMRKNIPILYRIGSSVVARSFRASPPSPEQRSFELKSAKKDQTFRKSKDGTSIGQLSQVPRSMPPSSLIRLMSSTLNIVENDLIKEIADFETSTFVQLTFALAVPDIYSYSMIFAPGFIHTVKIIEKHFEEISLCISTANFGHSSFIQNNIRDSKFIAKLNQALRDVTLEYGGTTYRLERAEHIRRECRKKDMPGILHRLWPNLVFTSTAIGSSFASYKKEIEFYCGEKLPLINNIVYASSEGFFGCLASIHTDEYFLTPTTAFFEFIKEEDIDLAQPKTLLISEIEPGNRYELVCTTDGGLVRYRMKDVIFCTRFLSRSDDLVPLPSEPSVIPRIPLVSIAYRVGSLLDVFGEKTTEQHLMYAFGELIHQCKKQEICIDIGDFTTYQKLDEFPPKYIIFLELSEGQGRKMNGEQTQTFQQIVDFEVDRHLCKSNNHYEYVRQIGKLGPPVCIFVRSGTFSSFRLEKLMTDRVSPLQIKPHRSLKNEDHIQFFYDNQIDISSL